MCINFASYSTTQFNNFGVFLLFLPAVKRLCKQISKPLFTGFKRLLQDHAHEQWNLRRLVTEAYFKFSKSDESDYR